MCFQMIRYINRRDGGRWPSFRGAFTLVEMLLVLGLIITLLSILAPSLQRARFQNRVVCCSTTLHQWGLASVMYAQDNRDWLPSHPVPFGGANTFDVGVQTAKAFEHYGVIKELWICPTTPASIIDGWRKFLAFSEIWITQTVDGQINGYYLIPGYSWWVPRPLANYMGGSYLFPLREIGTGRRFVRRITDNSAKYLPIMTDIVLKAPSGRYSTPYIKNNDPVDWDSWKLITRGEVRGVFGYHAWAGHLRNVNWLFADGHVETHAANTVRTRYFGFDQNLY
jgi:prepilin-type processing-associated H-X9-DG protein